MPREEAGEATYGRSVKGCRHERGVIGRSRGRAPHRLGQCVGGLDEIVATILPSRA